MTRPLAWAVALAAALVAGGCATTSGAGGPAAAQASAPSKADPWERLNRRVFAFNEALDEAVLQPVARAYRSAVPELVRTGVDNVFGNVADAWSAVNHLLQGKGRDAFEMTVRFTTNTVWGIGGVFDIASEAGIERRSEDLGQTVGRWGIGPGPFLMLPVLGPRTVRDTAALPVDRLASLSSFVSPASASYGVVALEVVHVRAGLLSTGNLLGQVALDKYSFVRDAYLAKRRNDVYDGNPPEEPEEDPAAGGTPRQ